MIVHQRKDTADPITTEGMRHALNSAANQMKQTLIRTSFSPIIYEVLEFAVAFYDRDVRLIAQAPTLPMFMGTRDLWPALHAIEVICSARRQGGARRRSSLVRWLHPWGVLFRLAAGHGRALGRRRAAPGGARGVEGW